MRTADRSAILRPGRGIERATGSPMESRSSVHARIALVVLLVGVVGLVGLVSMTTGCVERELVPLRRATYPPDFHYLTRDEIQTTMADFARSVDSLDGILSKAGGAGPADRDAVVGILEKLRLQAIHLESGNSSNHPRIHEDAPRFLRDIDRALLAAKREPPDYSWTGRIAGSCTACHAPRHPGAT